MALNGIAGATPADAGPGGVVMLHPSGILAACLVVLLAALPARAEYAGDAAAGAELAQAWCNECHVVDSRQTRGTDAVPSFAAIAAAPGTTAMSLRAFLTTPHGRMPDFKLSHTQIDDLAAYILSQRQK